MSDKETEQWLYEAYEFTRDFDFRRLNKYEDANEDLHIDDLILDYTMLYEFYKERTRKLQKENKRLKKIIIEQDEEQRKLFNHIVKDDYKPRIDKAIEYIEHAQNFGKEKAIYVNGDDLLDILRGE